MTDLGMFVQTPKISSLFSIGVLGERPEQAGISLHNFSLEALSVSRHLPQTLLEKA
jgi:hypothetical protein